MRSGSATAAVWVNRSTCCAAAGWFTCDLSDVDLCTHSHARWPPAGMGLKGGVARKALKARAGGAPEPAAAFDVDVLLFVADYTVGSQGLGTACDGLPICPGS